MHSSVMVLSGAENPTGLQFPQAGRRERIDSADYRPALGQHRVARAQLLDREAENQALALS
jgi:hypothetical protein